MSSNGYRQAHLNLQRMQRVQLQRVERQTRNFLLISQRKLNSVNNHIQRQLLEKQIHSSRTEIENIKNISRTTPDRALSSAKSLQKRINTAFSEAEERAKQIQLESLKKQAGDSLNDTAAMLQQIHDPAMQQLIGPEIRKLQPQIQKVSELVQKDPEKAAAQSKEIQKQFNKLIDQTQKQLEKEAEIKAKANAKLDTVKQQLEAATEEATDTVKETLQQVQTLIDTAEEQYQEGQYKALENTCQETQTLLAKASEKDFDETVRKEVVNGLLTTLGQMGFVVQPPYLDGDEKASQTVRLEGKLPSGKMAAFNVHLDGRMDFDFDGYEGRACAKELEKIDEVLNQQFSIQLSENKITWKNPDKIAKGAMQLPSGNRNTHLC